MADITAVAEQSATEIGEGAGAEVPPAPSAFEGIAILGSHPATVMLAPFDKNWLIYSCSPHNFERNKLPRWDQWFEIHKPIPHPTRAPAYVDFVKSLPFVWVRDRDFLSLPGAHEYPEVELKEEFGPFTFTSSIAFMLAKAIKDCEENGVRQIGLFGIMQASPNEYAYQRPGIQNLIWQAAKRGICVRAPRMSRLFDPQPEDF